MTHHRLKTAYLLLAFTLPLAGLAQKFTHQDHLRGAITPERAWWDLTHYALNTTVYPEQKSISGTNHISYKVLEGYQTLQLDLQEPLKITSATQNQKKLTFTREGSAYFIQLKDTQKTGAINTLTVTWEGKPVIAKNAPWDGGLVWAKDQQNRDFIATANQGIGASIWWPNKDHPYDEVDSLDMHITVPKNLINVSNGRLTGTDSTATTKTYHWTVKNPINNYGVNLNIGHYVNFKETYQGEKGTLDMDYWVLDYNLEKAKQQFKQAPMMMAAFEHWFGPYPFYEDSFKLVQAPYLGMEHQSSVTYGNGFKNGYRGRDLSNTGHGLKFDFIIIHEAGHEWFANNITNADVSDMWIHESFTAYSESLYLDYHFGKKAAGEYVIGTRRSISNDRPIIGVPHKNHRGSSDMYYKGANMLHTLRIAVNDDALWRQTLRGLNTTFYHQTVTSQEVTQYLQDCLNLDLEGFFNQYLNTTNIPVFEYKIKNNTLKYRLTQTVPNFKLPVHITINDTPTTVTPTSNWKTITKRTKITAIKVPKDYYFKIKKE